jgi:WD40 repeat protein
MGPSARHTPGQILGTRYRVVGLLGRGGMGEVWHAYDLKLQVDVALKSVLPERFPGERGLELLRREVRSAREVMSPNVCRIFDLVESEGRELVSMEFIDGTTLLDVLRERGPLELQEATRIASQFLAGLEAIHQAGLVHRDVKPENIMITRTGRVVLMDFGIAKGMADGPAGTIAGTPAYMAPEHLRGDALDARADIFAAGVMLAEMIAPAGIRAPESRESLWQAVRQAPVRLFDSPWRGVLERAVASEPSQRYDSARALARALEEVALRVEGAEDRHPYPGMSSFTAADAEFFFGREVEVEAVWKKLQRANLLTIIGPSGAGKTSFLQAGLLPAKPAEWEHVQVRPGASPFVALAQALVPRFAGDTEAMRLLVQAEKAESLVEVIGRWQAKHPHTLIVVDQFEELFTHCSPDVQAAFADLLGRLAIEADVHVLLVMRDDFLIRCHEHPRLAPISADLTMLGSPTGSALRRALVQPALLCGYRFEDESLADEMLAAIEGERGALPMLAFAAARLWEQRDRERGLLTREAYGRIGGVSGALAQHAEATLERIGEVRQPLVRELFRNLVTSQGTRAVSEVEELLSVFEDRKAAGEVLRELVDARLLTSFELPEAHEGRGGRHRVEIVHESLLASWPRLVRWRTQDTEGAQLRDQLRQASQLWRERGESNDLLWTGTAFREFELWRERYPGGLTATEEAFARAMVAHAERQRRRRRMALSAAFALLTIVVVVVGLYAQGERQARLGAEANKLLALGRVELDTDPSAALAYALSSLDMADNPTGRRFALEALSRSPAASATSPLAAVSLEPVFLDFSPDGKWLAAGGRGGVFVLSEDAAPATAVRDTYSVYVRAQKPQFAPDGKHLIWMSNEDSAMVRVWSIAARKDVRTFRLEGTTLPLVRGDRLFLITDLSGPGKGIGVASYPAHQNEFTGTWTRTIVRTWEFDDREPRIIAHWNAGGIRTFDIDAKGRWVAYPKGRGVYLSLLDELESGRARLVGEHAAEASRVCFDPTGVRLASSDLSGEIRLWSLAGGSKLPLRVIRGRAPLCVLDFDPTGGVLAVAYAAADKSVHLWDLNGPQDADPVILRRRDASLLPAVAFHPSQPWIAVAYHNEVAFWPFLRSGHNVMHGAGDFGHTEVGFTSDGKSLLGDFAQGIRIWSLHGGPTRDLWKPQSPATMIMDMALDPRDRFVVVGTSDDGAYRVSMQDGQARRLPDNPAGGHIHQVVISPDGRFVAGLRGTDPLGVRVWDLEAGTVRSIPNTDFSSLIDFVGDGRLLYSDAVRDIRWWNPADGSSSLVLTRAPRYPIWAKATRDGRYLFVTALTGASERDSSYISDTMTSGLTVFDLENHTSHAIPSHGNRLYSALALDTPGTILATADRDGVTRVGPITGEEPHLLLGGPGHVRGVAISSDGRWIAAGKHFEPTVDLWPMPTGRPFHTLPHAEFLDRLRALTCMRAVPDRKSPTGYRLDPAPFRGWGKVPTW